MGERGKIYHNHKFLPTLNARIVVSRHKRKKLTKGHLLRADQLWIYQMATTLNMQSFSIKTWVIITGSTATKCSLGNVLLSFQMCVICHFIIYFLEPAWGCSGLFERGCYWCRVLLAHEVCFFLWNDNCFTKTTNIFRFVQAMLTGLYKK